MRGFVLPMRLDPPRSVGENVSRFRVEPMEQRGFVNELLDWALFNLPNVQRSSSGVSTSPVCSLWLEQSVTKARYKVIDFPIASCRIARVNSDSSMFLRMSRESGRELIEKGWGDSASNARPPVNEFHCFGPRTLNELETVKLALAESYCFVLGLV